MENKVKKMRDELYKKVEPIILRTETEKTSPIDELVDLMMAEVERYDEFVKKVGLDAYDRGYKNGYDEGYGRGFNNGYDKVKKGKK